MAIPLGDSVRDLTVFAETETPIILVNRMGPPAKSYGPPTAQSYHSMSQMGAAAP